MSAEFSMKFPDASWYERNRGAIAAAIRKLATFVGEEDEAFLLRGHEEATAPGRWRYDVRIFLDPTPPARLEVSAHPPSIESDLAMLLGDLRQRTSVVVEDEDGEPSTW
jgi:hypothetical protein